MCICLANHTLVCSPNPGRRNQNFFWVLTCYGPPYIPPNESKSFVQGLHVFDTFHIPDWFYASVITSKFWPTSLTCSRLNQTHKYVINMGWQANWVKNIFLMNIEQIWCLTKGNSPLTKRATSAFFPTPGSPRTATLHSPSLPRQGDRELNCCIIYFPYQS